MSDIQKQPQSIKEAIDKARREALKIKFNKTCPFTGEEKQITEIPQDIPLKELLNSVGVSVTPYNGRGCTLIDSKTGEQLHKTPYASYDLGQEIYLERAKENPNDN